MRYLPIGNLLFIICLIFSPIAHAQTIILAPDPILNGRTQIVGAEHSSSSYAVALNNLRKFVSISPADGSFSLSLQGDTPYRLRTVLFYPTLNYSMLIERDMPAIPQGGIDTLSQVYSPSLIKPVFTVLGGTVTNVHLLTEGINPDNGEAYLGEVKHLAANAPIDTISLPSPLIPEISLRGTVTATIPEGCEVQFGIDPQTVPLVPGTTSVPLDIDLTNYSCSSLAGTIGHQDTSIVVNEYEIILFGAPGWHSQKTDSTGAYGFPMIGSGIYDYLTRSYLAEPYGTFSRQRHGLTVNPGEQKVQDFITSVSKVKGNISLAGTWGLNDTWHATAYSHAPGTGLGNTQSSDSIDFATGDYHLLFDANKWYVHQYSFLMTSPLDFIGRATSQSFGFYSYQNAIQVDADGINPITLPQKDIVTSEALIFFSVLNQMTDITTLNMNGRSEMLAPVTNVSAGHYYFDLINYGVQSPNLSVLLRATPGLYNITAVGNGADGVTYRETFPLEVGTPLATPAGNNVTIDHQGKVRLLFSSVVTPGDTVVNAVGFGPQPPATHTPIVVDQNPVYYDIKSNAIFSGDVETCFAFDPAKVDMTKPLTVQHYVCDDTNQNCTWQDITTAGTAQLPDQVCGKTQTFDYFSVMEEVFIDQDGDGISDQHDNCPSVPNSDQADSNGDGVGNACEPDNDGDGVANYLDNCPNIANADQLDTNGNGIGNACEADSDGDGVIDEFDNCPSVANAGQLDTNGNGIGNACEADFDGDGVIDEFDNCPTKANPDQADSNGDGVGDICEPDNDGDGVANYLDNCPNVANANQLDRDGNGMGNACEPDSDGDGFNDDIDLCPLTASGTNTDLDGDGVGDACDYDIDGDGVDNTTDNCSRVSNADQANFDADAFGDVCDSDVDNDLVANGFDKCAFTPLGTEVNADGCDKVQGVDQLCPKDKEYRNHGEYVVCVGNAARELRSAGLIDKRMVGSIVSEAAQSDIGKKAKPNTPQKATENKKVKKKTNSKKNKK